MKKSTKKSLLFSVLALILCTAMLLGTTFAWFTDTKTTGVNKIQAGTLKIDLQDAAGASLVGRTLSFHDKNNGTNILWEPGATFETQQFKVVSTGSLALKYKIELNGTNVSDNALMEVIKLKVVDAAGNAIALDTFEGHLTAGSNSGLMKITATMDSAAGNKYQGQSWDGISITVIATQDTVENDIYGNTYDENASYPLTRQDEFNSALASGGSITMAADMKAVSSLDITNNTSLSLGGKTLTIGDNTELKNGANLTVSGGTVLRETYSGYVDVRPGTTTDSVITYTDVVFDNTYKTKTYGPCTDRVESALEFCPENGGNATFYFKSCTFNNSRVLFEGLSGTTGSFTATFENCTFNNLGTSAGIEVANYLTGDITIKDCTFNLTATATMYAVKSSNSTVTWNFEGINAVNGYAATASGEEGTVDQIKVMNNPSVKVYSINTTNSTTVNGLGTVTVSGIATK